ncbi:hypothetical protein FRC03_005163 [Tulasnella sp. 419]|nr:hypothetical protein FRC03_005163 [Tulasnella sp. 419]
MQTTATSTDLASSLIVDVREFIEASRRASEIQAQATGKATGSATWKSLRPVLAALLVGSSTLDADLNQLVTSMLGTGGLTDVAKASLFNGLRGACTSLVGQTNMDVWKISPEHTALRLIATLSLLRTASLVEDFDSLANQVATLLTSSLGDIIGDGFRYPSLETLAQYLYDPCIEVKQAARSLFFAETQRLPDLDAVSLVEVIRHRLPTLQPDSHKESSYAALALVVTGHVTVENYTLISTETLTDISKSIALYLHDEHSEHRVIAIELCSAGFHIWQHYVDAMAALRSLFTLATSQRKDGVSAQARSAVLQIASTNTPLFMTTLSLDVLNPPSLEYRKTIMQLVAFIIRKKPLVLYPNLPRLVEAVVKSLDPNSAASREMVLDTATEILGHVVSTFPTVDFHKASQRLAVGTGEGAVIMYDLKTATRLYVLEGHKKRVTAISFSPDGRRLATVSLEESVVMGWKVGSSFSSFFHPGAPPWQGSSGSDPFKKLEFNVGDEGRFLLYTRGFYSLTVWLL